MATVVRPVEPLIVLAKESGTDPVGSGVECPAALYQLVKFATFKAVCGLDVNPVALQHRQTQRVLEQSMLGAAVAVVAEDDAAAKSAQPCAGRRGVVDAAKAFMRSRISEPITVADLCRELGVSRRTLQYGFQEVLGINPVAFLRATRLNGVRRDLKAASRPRDSVQDIAARWGFWHLGHFVTDYKRMFGELPSETLRGRRAARGGSRR